VYESELFIVRIAWEHETHCVAEGRAD